MGSILKNRIVFKGLLIPQTSIRIGSAQYGSDAYNPLFKIKLPNYKEIFIIPASSLRGVLRHEYIRLLSIKAPHSSYCFQYANTDIDQETHLCSFCEIFGSQKRKGKLKTMDCYPLKEKEKHHFRPRIAIDRTSHTNKEGHLAFFENHNPLEAFHLKLILENFNPTSNDHKLFLFVLYELMHGFVKIGGQKSAGLGTCTIQDFTVDIFDYEKQKVYLIPPVTKPFLSYYREIIQHENE
ncbi:MAG: RAMP superfamily CRISPR-associated protein [Candidatus Helarchaeota archaeon]